MTWTEGGRLRHTETLPRLLQCLAQRAIGAVFRRVVRDAEANAFRGVVCVDTRIVFDKDGVPAKHVQKRPQQNSYIHTGLTSSTKSSLPEMRWRHPLALKDRGGARLHRAVPYIDQAMHRLQEFYTQTFWKNGHASRCTLAALALALRGQNLDRCSWGIGPGVSDRASSPPILRRCSGAAMLTWARTSTTPMVNLRRGGRDGVCRGLPSYPVSRFDNDPAGSS